MTRVVVCSDTHLPQRPAAVPGWLADHLRRADHAIHAGDVIAREVLFELRVLAGSLTAVQGNRDPDLPVPATATVDVEGVRFAVRHGADLGRGEAYRRGLAAFARATNADVAVGGHTHRVLDDHVHGVRVLNPGSATGTAPADEPTLLVVDCEGGTSSVSVARP